MQFLRTYLAFAVVSVCALGIACSSSTNSSVDNGTFNVPASVAQNATFEATYTANTPTVYPHVQVLPVSTYYIDIPDSGVGFVAKQAGNPAMYAVSNGLVLGYTTIKVEAAK